MKDEKKERRSIQRRVRKELGEIWGDTPVEEWNGLVEWQVWMKLMREKQQSQNPEE